MIWNTGLHYYLNDDKEGLQDYACYPGSHDVKNMSASTVCVSSSNIVSVDR